MLVAKLTPINRQPIAVIHPAVPRDRVVQHESHVSTHKQETTRRWNTRSNPMFFPCVLSVIGIDTNIEVIVVSLTTWEADHSPRARAVVSFPGR